MHDQSFAEQLAAGRLRDALIGEPAATQVSFSRPWFTVIEGAVRGYPCSVALVIDDALVEEALVIYEDGSQLRVPLPSATTM
jgi:hypothetical protein